MIGLPFSLVMLFVTYFLLTKVLHPIRIPAFSGGRSLIQGEYNKLGNMTEPERRVLWIFIGTAVLWVSGKAINSAQDFIHLNDVRA